MEVIVEGTGAKTIVMIHGWPDTYRLWDGQVAALKDRYRCVRFTLPGFDAGPKRAIPFGELLDTLKKIVEEACPGQRVTLLLHDWGCFFGYQFAARHPQLVERIVGVDIGDAGSRAHRAELRPKDKLALIGYQLWLSFAWVMRSDGMARWMARKLRCPTDARAIYAQMGYGYAMRWLGVAGGFRNLKVFKPHCPMLFMYGQRKRFMFHSRAWAQGVESKAFPTGHWIMVERPQEFNAALLAWLRAG
jgi:pimeloyl-ACP methyl ester carboxylesterase